MSVVPAVVVALISVLGTTLRYDFKMNALSHYHSLSARYLEQPLCITWVAGLDVDEVLAKVGGLPETATQRTFTAAVGASYDVMPQYAGVALAGSLGDWVLLIEPNGFQGKRPAILSSLAVEGRALCVFWNLDGDFIISYAERGQVLSSSDPLDPEGDVPSALMPLIDTAAFHEDWNAAALSLAESVTGQRLAEEWLSHAHLSMVVQSLPDQSASGVTQDQRLFLADEPRVSAIVMDPNPHRLREIAALIAETAREATGLTGLSADRALAELRSYTPNATVSSALRDELARWQDDLLAQAIAEQTEGSAAQHSVADTLHRKSLAVAVLSAALNDDPLAAATDAVWRIGVLRLDDTASRRVGTLWSCLEEIKSRL